MKRNLWFLTIALLLVLVGCSNKPATSIDGRLTLLRQIKKERTVMRQNNMTTRMRI
ncbi:hypothetical protein [Sporosarcina sp. P18a]|uniref:hypothetical protein n=1 Tax=Sporosarcina sp. P18a TaxID=2048259 RepID=UPI0013044CEA|nr:hypothetical protein [Sporosarcina sp. P18a]